MCQSLEHPSSRRFARQAGLAILIAVGQFAAVSAAAMSHYPGGNEWDWHAKGYSFWRNTLSDLGQPTAGNGLPNSAWPAAFNASLVGAFVAFVPLWLALPTLFARARRIAAAVRGLGMISVVGGVLVGLLPAGHGIGHAVGIGLSSVPGLAALVLAIVGLARCHRRAMAAFSVGLLLVGLVHFWQYVAFFWLGLPWSPAAPAMQKVAVLYGLTWMAVVGVQVGLGLGSRVLVMTRNRGVECE